MPGAYLKQIRERLGLSVRQVERLSRIIADARKSKEYSISHGWLTKLEKEQSIPGVHTLFSLSVIYRTSFAELLSLYDIPLRDSREYTQLVKLTETNLISKGFSGDADLMSHQIASSRYSAPKETMVLLNMLEQRGDISIAALKQLGIRIARYGFIGLNDYTLYPMVRPGALVLIDEGQNKVISEGWQTEYDRPIYFLELQGGYACGWCILEGNILTLIPHQMSPSAPQQFHYPRDVSVVGRVKSVFSHWYDPQKNSLPQTHSPPGKRKPSHRRK